MKLKTLITMGGLLAATLGAAQAQTTIADWNFDSLGTQAAPYNSPAPSTGSGTATVLGMSNNYNDGTTGSSPYADVLSTPGASTGANSYGWRIRGGSTTGGAGTPNGWSTNAPVGTQGAQFAANTTGYNNIGLSFDLYTTGQAEANVAVEYTLNGTTWNDVSLISYSGAMSTAVHNNTTSAGTIMGEYLQLKTAAGGWYNDITAILPSTAANDPNFAIKIVNASTGTDDINQSGTIYNNNSGNWRYDNVNITGSIVPVPEPNTLACFGLGFTAFIAICKFRKR